MLEIMNTLEKKKQNIMDPKKLEVISNHLSKEKIEKSSLGISWLIVTGIIIIIFIWSGVHQIRIYQFHKDGLAVVILMVLISKIMYIITRSILQKSRKFQPTDQEVETVYWKQENEELDLLCDNIHRQEFDLQQQKRKATEVKNYLCLNQQLLPTTEANFAVKVEKFTPPSK